MSILLGFAVALAATFLIGRKLVPWLAKEKAGQMIKEDGPKWHMSKQGTPTMGGLMFIFGILIALVTVGMPSMISGDFGGLSVFLFALVFGLIGFVDDFCKIWKHQNTGLRAYQKFLLQLAASVVFTIVMIKTGFTSMDLYFPFFDVTWHLPFLVYLLVAAFIMVGTVNAVNLTDGVDGLATGVTIPVAVFFITVSVFMEKTSLSIFSAALLGSLLAFLYYNFHPAKVFMGDTGSLFLGGCVCGLAFALDMPIILVFVGFVYLVETLSDIIQVTYFKLSHGKRIFKMAPLHHHFEMCGWSEVKIFTVFTVVSAIMCLVGFFGCCL